MKARRYFLLTTSSGMIGMLALIATSLFKHRIANNVPRPLSDEDIDHLLLLSSGLAISMILSQLAITALIVFLILFLIARRNQQNGEIA